MKTRIGVAVRVRPLLEHEKKLNMKMSKLFVNPDEKEIRINTEDQRSSKIFKFDRVFDENTNQEQLYNESQIDDLINKVVEGYNSTIFAYGQTGSGKTFTMEGFKYDSSSKDAPHPVVNLKSKDIGIVPRAISSLFETIKSHSKLYSRIYTVHCSYLQIYNEKIFDLLNPSQIAKAVQNSPGLRLRWIPKDQFVVENLFVFECKNPNEAMEYFQAGLRNKIMASHKLNLASSRSHSILTFRVESTDLKNSDNTIVSRLDLVDLAGSERSSLTGNDSNIAQKESIEINKSLFTLRQVISIIAEAQRTEKKDRIHVPYRDSKLTCLLKSSIGGNSYCLMVRFLLMTEFEFACLSPSDRYFEENVSTLTYATKAAYISNEPMKNDDPKTKQINDLKAQVLNLTRELAKANDHITFLSQLTNERVKTFGVDFFKELHSEEAIANTHPRSTNVTPEQGARDHRRVDSAEQSGSRYIKQSMMTESQNQRNIEAIYERLIGSINTVRDLLKSNKEIRENMEKLGQKNESLNGEIIHLHQENQDLRDRLSVFEQVINPNVDAKDQEDLLRIQDLNGMMNQGSIINELIALRKEKKILENRIRNLEFENTELQRVAKPKNLAYKEPLRTVYEIDKNAYDYTQAVMMKTRIFSNGNESMNNSVIVEKRGSTMSPGKHSPKPPAYLKPINPIQNTEIDPMSYATNLYTFQKKRTTADESDSHRNSSMMEYSNYLRNDPLEGAFRKVAPNTTMQKFKRNVPLISRHGNHSSEKQLDPGDDTSKILSDLNTTQKF